MTAAPCGKCVGTGKSIVHGTTCVICKGTGRATDNLLGQLRDAAEEVRVYHPAAAVSLPLGQSGAFVVVGTGADIRKLVADDLIKALRQSCQAIGHVLTVAGVRVDADTHVQLVNAWQAARFELDRLK